MPVPPEPAVPTLTIVASSEFADAFSSTIVWPAARPVTLATLMLFAPTAEAAARVVPGERVMIDVLFSSSMFASPTPPTSQPALV